MIQVEFAASDAATALTQEPTRVGYSQHEGVEIADWGDVKLEVVDGTHPVVHPAAGSHANYYDAALFLGRSGQQGFGCDDSRAPTTDVRPAVALVPSDAAAVGGAATRGWTTPAAGASARRASTTARPGPNTKDQWTRPLTWTDEEGAATAYAVPASGLYGTQATSSFCGIVATGSDLLRLAMNNLAVATLALLAIALVVSLAGAPHHLAPLRPAAPGPPPQHRPGHRRRVADVPGAGPALRRHRRCRSPSRRSCPASRPSGCTRSPSP